LKLTGILLFTCLLTWQSSNGQLPATLLGDSLMNLQRFDEAIVEYSNLIEHKKIDSLDLGNAYLRRGKCLVLQDFNDKGILDYFTALTIFEKINLPERIAAAASNIGAVFFTKKDYANADKYFRRACGNYLDLKDSSSAATTLNDLAIVLHKHGNFKQAVATHLLVLNSYQTHLTKESKLDHLLNLGASYIKLNMDSALYYFRLVEGEASRSLDSVTLIYCYNNIGEILNKQGLHKESLKYFLNGLDLSLRHGDSSNLAVAYSNLAEVYNNLNDYGNAYNYSAKSNVLSNKIYDAQLALSRSELSEKYESDKKDATIKSQLLEANLRERNLVYLVVALGLAISLISVSIFFNRRIRRRNNMLTSQNNAIVALNTKLDESNRVKTTLFSVIGHDIRGPISNIYSFCEMTRGKSLEQVDLALDTIAKKSEALLDTLEDLLIWSRSQLDQFEFLNGSIDLDLLIREILHIVEPIADDNHAEFEYRPAQGLKLSTDREMLKIVVRNILQNAVSYCENDTVILVLTTEESGMIKIEVSNTKDNSLQMLSESHKIATGSRAHGFGHQLISEFVKRLNGDLEFQDSDLVYKVTLTLPQLYDESQQKDDEPGHKLSPGSSIRQL